MDDKPTIINPLDDKTARKLVRERNSLRKDYDHYQKKLWRTPISSPEFLIYQKRFKDIESILDARHEEFRNAFFHFLRIPPKNKK